MSEQEQEQLPTEQAQELVTDNAQPAEANIPAAGDVEEASDGLYDVSSLLEPEQPPANEEQGEVTSVPETSTMRELRAHARRVEAERKRLQAEVEQLKSSGKAQPEEDAELKPPSLWENTNPDEDGDQEVFARKMEAYVIARKEREYKKQEVERQKQAEAATIKQQVDALKATYEKLEGKHADAVDARRMIETTLSLEQRSAVMHAAESPAIAAHIFYLIGGGLLHGTKEYEDLAKLDGANLGKFVKKIGLLEAKIMSAPKRAAVPPPENRVKPNAPVVTKDGQLAALEAEADRTGDRTKLIQFYRSNRGT